MTGPRFRSLDQLTGDVAERPSAFFRALSEATEFCREVDGVKELRARIDEITAERDELREELARLEARK